MANNQTLSAEAPEVLVIAESVKHMTNDMEGTVSIPSSFLYIMTSMLLSYAERYEDYAPDPSLDVSKVTELLNTGNMTVQ